MSASTPLRFAAFVRVSTEKQERQGASLAVQRQDITEAVARLGGTVAAWYGGQEHATPGWERREFDRLLADAAAGAVDAVMVTYADRWARDNQKSKAGLATLRKHGVRFFIGDAEQDLHDPTTCFTLGMHAEVGEFFARTQNKKTQDSKRQRAKAGRPCTGRLPWGRTWSVAAGWGLDADKVQAIRQAAGRFLAGEPLAALAGELGVSYSRLYATLAQRCGPEWSQSLRRHGVVEVYHCAVPELLDSATVAAVRARLVANRTYLRGQQKYQYLLSGLVRCAACGTGMTGCAKRSGTRFYKHVDSARSVAGRGCPFMEAPAADLEAVVVRHLFEVFGNPLALERAVERALPQPGQAAGQRAEVSRLARGIGKCQKERSRLVKAVAEGVLSSEDVKDHKAKIDQREQALSGQRGRLLAALATAEEPEAVKARVRTFADAGLRAASRFEAMTWEDQRALCQLVLGGHGPDGTKLGAYISRRPDGYFSYELRGHLVEGSGWFPLPAANPALDDEDGPHDPVGDYADAFAYEDRLKAGGGAGRKLLQGKRPSRPCSQAKRTCALPFLVDGAFTAGSAACVA
jgi:site-specific DNA recombinase